MSSPANTQADTPRRPRRLRWVWRTLLFVAVFVVGWYVLGRATDGVRRMKVVEDTAASSTAPPVLAEGGSLTVAAYNIAHARGLVDTNWAGERDARLTDIADLVASWDADVVVLNEVDLDAAWSGRVNQARVLAERAGYAYRAEQSNYDLWLPGFRIRFGNAVLSRFPIVHAQPIDYPAVSGWESAAFGRKRGLVCTLDLGTGRRVRVVAVHWDTRDAAVRAGSAEAIAALAGDGGRLQQHAAGRLRIVRRGRSADRTRHARMGRRHPGRPGPGLIPQRFADPVDRLHPRPAAPEGHGLPGRGFAALRPSAGCRGGGLA